MGGRGIKRIFVDQRALEGLQRPGQHGPALQSDSRSTHVGPEVIDSSKYDSLDLCREPCRPCGAQPVVA